jgi:general secretion pathway protein G
MIGATDSILSRKTIIVVTVAGILGLIAASNQLRSVHKAREAVLREDLHTVRTALDSYTKDRGKAPPSMDDLVVAGYLKTIPGAPLDTY